MDDQTLIIAVIGAILLAVLYRAFFVDGKKSDDGRIDGKHITEDQLFQILSKFTPQKINKKQVERGIQKELGLVLKNAITLVTDEYGLEGVNGRNIDFDIGYKKFGIELKVAKSLLKTAEWDRFQSQLRHYLTHYKDDNLILIVFGSKSEHKETIMHSVEVFCKEKKIHFIYKNIEYNDSE